MTHTIAVVGAGLSVLADSLQTLLIARFIAGAGMASVVPAVIAWVGEVLPPDQRVAGATDMNSAYATGAAAGVLGAGLLADARGWAWGFGASGLLGGLALLATLRLFSPPPPATPGSLRVALGVPAVRWLAGIALVEGATLFGLFAFLAPTLLATGASASLAGVLIAAYGLSVVLWSRVARAATPRVPVLRLMAFGGAMLTLGWSAVAWSPGAGGVLSASVMMGSTIIFFHSQLQVWATQAAPQARGPGIAMFSGCLFVGASLGTALGRPLFAAGQVQLLFAVGALTAPEFGLNIWLSARWWARW